MGGCCENSDPVFEGNLNVQHCATQGTQEATTTSTTFHIAPFSKNCDNLLGVLVMVLAQ